MQDYVEEERVKINTTGESGVLYMKCHPKKSNLYKTMGQETIYKFLKWKYEKIIKEITIGWS